MKQDCSTCRHSQIELKMSKMKWKCDMGLSIGCSPCPKWELDRPHVAAEKPPIGCAPYYIGISARICELCEAIKRYSTESRGHNLIKLWTAEIQYLNEMDRMLRRVEEEKTWVEEKDGTLKEVE